MIDENISNAIIVRVRFADLFDIQNSFSSLQTDLFHKEI